MGPLLARAYAAEVGRRNRRFDRGHGVVTLDRPVVSVGNLSVGGTGKTPMVSLLVRAMREMGRDPAVAMRGYAAKDGLSDEAEAYRAAIDDLPVVAQANRVDGLIDLFATERGERVDAVVLDDGFQHRRIARQVDIVLIDATRDPFAGDVLPAGWLREPVASLVRADAVVVTHAEAVGAGEIAALRARVQGVAPDAVLAVCRHAWRGLVVSDGGVERREPVAWLRGRRVAAACAIGNPAAFLAEVRRACGEAPASRVVLRDHDPMGPGVVSRLRGAAAGVEALVVTEKDWAKLRSQPAETWACPVVRPELDLVFDEGLEAVLLLVGEAVGGVVG